MHGNSDTPTPSGVAPPGLLYKRKRYLSSFVNLNATSMPCLLYALSAFVLLSACALASPDVCDSFPNALGSSIENCTTEEVGFIQYNVTTDIAKRCGEDLQWHVIGLGSAGDASSISASQLQSKVYCTGHGIYNVATKECQCFHDAVNGYHIGNRCKECYNGTARSCDSLDYPCFDTEDPVLTLIGDTVVTILQHHVYEDQGASASDNIDGYVFPVPYTFDVPFNASIPNAQYTITYTYSDFAGNAATPVTRTLIVLAQDECALGTHVCDTNAICTDTLYGHTCTCKYGYTGDGVTCADVNECAVNNGGCHADASCTNTPGGFTCSCDSGLIGDGVNCVPVSLYCLRDFEGGHWALVRRVPQNSSTWGPWNDNAAGTVSVGSIDKDPLSLTTWTIPYSGYSYSNMLFTTGNYLHWVIIDKDELASRRGATNNCNNPHVVQKTALNGASHVLGWCNRQRATEDPWIAERDHSYSQQTVSHSMVYGEVKNGWSYYRTAFQGANVFIQSEQLCPQRVFCASSSFQGGGWALVRRSSHNSATWGPWSDNALGTEEEYGDYIGSPTAAESFSLKYSNFDFDEVMFATGDFQYWVRMNMSELLAGQVAGSGCNTTREVLSSHVHPDVATEVDMCNRASYGEDPWISARDYDYSSESAEHSMLYGEDSSSDWAYYRENHFGANVFIRNFDLCPTS